MTFKTPNLTNRFFDPKIVRKPLEPIYQDKPYPVKIKSQSQINVNNPNNPQKHPRLQLPKHELRSEIGPFHELGYPSQKLILRSLLNAFQDDLAITENTVIYQLWLNKTLVAVVCSKTDEQVGEIFRTQGVRHIENLGIRSDGIYLYNLWVNPFYRKQGAAKMVISLLEKKARQLGKRSIRLQIEDDNQTSFRLFKGLGYLEESRIPTGNKKVQINLSRWLS